MEQSVEDNIDSVYIDPRLLEDKKVVVVQLDAHVVLQIIKHCQDGPQVACTGQLLGIDIAGTLEVTNSFPFAAAHTAANARDEDGAEYQIKMLRCLQELNFDTQSVGWYQSTLMGSFWNQAFIEAQYTYQKAFENSVVIIYDPVRTVQGAGSLSLRALRLTDAFMELYRKSSFTMESLMKHKLTPSAVFESLPVKIRRSHLLNVMLHELNSKRTFNPSIVSALDYPQFSFNDRIDAAVVSPLAPNLDHLQLNSDVYLEKHLEYLSETIDEHGQEQWRWQGWQRSFQKEQQKAQQNVANMKAENQAAIAAGNDPIYSEEDLKAKPASLQKVIGNEPSRLETLIITNQIDEYCKQISQFVGSGLMKIFLTKGVQHS